MGSHGRWAQRWIVPAGSAGLFVVLCVLAGFSLLTQQRVARSAHRANAASVLSTIYQDARYRVGLEQSLVRQFRLSPDVSVLTARGQAEVTLVSAKAAYEKAEVELDRAIGLLLDHAGIQIADAERGEVTHAPNIPHVVARPADQPMPANPPAQSQQ